MNLLTLAPLVSSCTLAITLGLSSSCVFANSDVTASENTTPAATYNAASSGTRNLTLDPVTVKMLLDASNLGRSDIEVGEVLLPISYESTVHPHGVLEIFYVVEGIMGHEVNGKAHTLNPGDVGFVNPGDKVKHSVLSDMPVKAVVIWLPGGEADALVEHAGFKSEKIN